MPKPFEDNRSENMQLRANEQQLRAANQQLKAKEAELESLARFPSENPHPVLRISNDGTVIYHNDASRPLLAHWDCDKGGKLPELWQKIVKQTLEDKKPLESTVECDGKSYSLSFAPVPANNYVNIYATDITTRLKTQKRLREKEAILLKTSQLGKMGGWEYYPKTGDVIWTEEVARIHDLDPTAKTDVTTALTYYTESSRSLLKAALEEVVNQGTPYDLEVEMITAKGNRKWVRAIGEAILENAECVKVRGMIQDITAQKQIEQQLRASNQQLAANEQQLRAADQQLRASNQQLRASESQLKAYNQQLKEINEKLQDSEERFRLLMEQSPSVIEIYDRSGLQIAVNKAYEELWGFPAEHTVNRFNVLKSQEVRRRGLLEPLQRAYAGEAVTLPEYEYDATGDTEGRGMGRKRWLHTRIYPIKDKNGNVENIVITHEDITNRKQAEEAMQKNEERFRLMYEQLPLGYQSLDEAGRLIEVNPKWLSMMGYTKEEVIGRPFREFLPERYRPIQSERFQRFKTAGEVRSVDFKLIRKDGAVLDVEIDGEVGRNPDGTFKQTHCVLNDVTERIKAQREREKLVRILSAKNEELQSIVYVASHDLKSPLVNICGFGKLLSKHCEQLKDGLKENEIDDALAQIVDREISEDIDFILQSAEKMNALINGLLEVSRAGMMALTIRPLNMNELIEAIIRNVSYKAQQTGAAITVDPLAPCVGDTAQISRVFTNLIENALKYADPSRKPRIHISAAVSGDHCVYCVEDNGIGIDSAYHGKIFEIFHRLNPQHVSDGEGLGLTIVRRILDRHSGTVWLESAAGKGSKFFVSLSNKEAL